MEKRKKPVTYAHVMKKKEREVKSIWDKDIDFDKVEKLSKKDKARLFPFDFDASGEPYGDF